MSGQNFSPSVSLWNSKRNLFTPNGGTDTIEQLWMFWVKNDENRWKKVTVPKQFQNPSRQSQFAFKT